MNVLVYSGPEVLQSALSRSISLLRSILYPHYTVQLITPQSLSSHPWQDSCALLVFPPFREHLSLTTNTSNTIRAYVDNGGAFLAFRAGIRASEGLLAFGSTEFSLRFYDKHTGKSVNCYLAPGEDENGQPAVITLGETGESVADVIATRSADLVGVESMNTVKILARYAENGQVAGVAFRINDGRVAVWGARIEGATSAGATIPAGEEGPRTLLRETLRIIGLQLPIPNGSAPAHPLPQFLTGIPSKPDIVPSILSSLSVKVPFTIEDSQNTFVFHPQSEGATLLAEKRIKASAEGHAHIIPYTHGSLPDRSLTPSFDIQQYYTYLNAAREGTVISPNAMPWGFGEAFMYGEAVTSTQTLINKNSHFLSSLPSPVLSLATHQLAGRGRGGNSWLSPEGCLQFSLRLRVALSELPFTKLVFIQYIFALAVVEACRDDAVLGQYGDRVRLKWPNDVYIVSENGEEKKKAAGILVYTTIEGTLTDIVIGCGLNVSSPPPVVSLASLIPPGVDRALSMERTAATIMVKFESFWSTFIAHRGSFDPFMDLYLDRWLHSDQLVTLTTTTPNMRVRIVGITSDFGLLRTLPEGGGHRYIDLQPDGNSFDLMSGLIMTKAN